MSFEINPCKAVREKVQSANCDINTMNDLCYGVARAYGKVYGPKLKKKLEDQCVELITEKKCTNGHDSCYMRRPTPPPEFNQMDHYFPYLFKKSKNVSDAFNKCSTMCQNTRFPNTCIDNCKIDASAIQPSGHIESFDHIPTKLSTNSNNITHTTIYISVSVIIVLIIILFIVFHNKF